MHETKSQAVKKSVVSVNSVLTVILVKEKKTTRKCENFRQQPADLPPCSVFAFACAVYSEYASKDISL